MDNYLTLERGVCHQRVSALVWVCGCAPCGDRLICRIGTGAINPGRARASTINPGRTRASIINPVSAALARPREWRFPADEGDRRLGRCRATGGPGPGLFPGALRWGFFPGLSAGDFSRGSPPGIFPQALRQGSRKAWRRQRDIPGMSGAGTAGCGRQVSGAAGAGRVKPPLRSEACERLSAIENRLIRCHRQHTQKKSALLWK